MSRLDPWRNGLDFPKGEDGDRILAGNFEEIAKNFDKTGLYLRGGVTASTAQSISATTYTDVTALKLSVSMTGGLCAVFAAVGISMTNDSADIRLLIGNEEKDQGRWSGQNVAGFAGGSKMPLMWIGNIEAGQKVFKIQAKSVGGGTANFHTNQKSTFYVVEFCKG